MFGRAVAIRRLGSLPILSFVPATVGALFAGISLHSAGDLWTLQATAASQKYLPPPGFQAWDGGPITPSTSVWSAADAAANGMTLSNGGLTVTYLSGGNGSVRGTISHTSGKYYVEFLAVTTGGDEYQGVADATFIATNHLGTSGQSAGVVWNGTNVFGSFTANYTNSVYPNSGDVVGVAVDFSAGSVWVAFKGTWVGGSNPGTGSLPIFSFVPATAGALFPCLSPSDANSVWTLQSTAASQKYAPPAGFSAWDSAAPTHSPQALAYLARTVGGNEGGNGANIANLIDGLVSDGVWAKLDALYVLAQQNATDAALNLVSTSYTLTPSTATFTTYKGYSNFPSTGGVNTGFIPASAPSPNYVLLSASAGVWVYEQDTNGGVQIGSDLNSYLEIASNFNLGGTFACDVNTTSVSVPTPGSTGLFTGDTAAATIVHPYWNGVDQGAHTGTGSNIPGSSVRIGGVPTAGWYNAKNLSAAFIGASLGSAGQLALYNRLRTYMTAVGVP